MALDIQSTLSPCPVQLDPRPVPFRVGLVALATDHTTERDYSRLIDPAQVGVYATRIAFENPTTPASLLKTGPRLTEAAAQIFPGEALDVIAYACTAASVVLGNDVVEKHLNAAKPSTPCVTPSSAAFDAFAALGVRRISVLTPYTVDVTDELVGFFEANGLEVVSSACLGMNDDREMARVSEECVIAAGAEAMHPQAEALFISCTALRAAQCAGRIEGQIGVPVVTSNQAMVWRTLRHLSLTTTITGEGRIFDL
ncbi:ectoine utilization protein EutA [Roseovarius aestuarii]|uniref:Maleate isomerase n=1 Tax=Roseovarius aestuarii TaxID=475083 RepID=A0A1X7BXZ7_9RHOB|nr:ectoine utilization protein EutA [Roseovarius aestuarii]SMC14453.1 Maleate isomerase [Roseovarius aestuarii]